MALADPIPVRFQENWLAAFRETAASTGWPLQAVIRVAAGCGLEKAESILRRSRQAMPQPKRPAGGRGK